MTQITDYEIMMAKIIRDRWKQEIEESIDRVKYGKAFCAERRRVNLIWRRMLCESGEQRRARIGPTVEDD
ncbi:MAG: hypothetical protein Q7T18_08560 [Sedimentisphaerales bacterium]|nr:hypothetical protein [Sedimentisphaerales bacterium]